MLFPAFFMIATQSLDCGDPAPLWFCYRTFVFQYRRNFCDGIPNLKRRRGAALQRLLRNHKNTNLYTIKQTHLNIQYPTLNFQPVKDWNELGYWIFLVRYWIFGSKILRSIIVSPSVVNPVMTEHNPPEAGKPSRKLQNPVMTDKRRTAKSFMLTGYS